MITKRVVALQKDAPEEVKRSDADVLVTVDLAEDVAPSSNLLTESSSQEVGQFRTTVIVHTTPAEANNLIGDAAIPISNDSIISPASLAGGVSEQITGPVASKTGDQGAVGMAPLPLGSSNIRHSNEMSHHPMSSVFRRLGKSDARKHPPEVQRVASSNSMSVSVPNLTSSMEQTVSFLESFSAVVRRNLGNNPNNMVVGSSNPCSSLVRLALSSNSSGWFYTGLATHLHDDFSVFMSHFVIDIVKLN